MNWLNFIPEIVMVLAIGLAWVNGWRLRRTRQTLTQALERAASSEAGLKFSEAAADEMKQEIQRLQARLDRIALENRRVHGGDERTDILTAIDLTRRGADSASLAGSCRLSRGEARLIDVLYGRSRPDTSAQARH